MSFNKKGIHELKRKAVRRRMRLHKMRCDGRIGPEGHDLAHHHAWSKPANGGLKKAVDLSARQEANTEVVKEG